MVIRLSTISRIITSADAGEKALYTIEKNSTEAKNLKVCDFKISKISSIEYFTAQTTKNKGIRKDEGCTGIIPILNKNISANDANNIIKTAIKYFIL